MDSSILFPAEIVNPRLIKVAYTRLNFVERRVIPHVENFSQNFFAEVAEAHSGAPALGRRLGPRRVHGEIGSEIAIKLAQKHREYGAEAHRARLRGPSGLSQTSAMEWSGSDNRVKQPGRRNPCSIPT